MTEEQLLLDKSHEPAQSKARLWGFVIFVSLGLCVAAVMVTNRPQTASSSAVIGLVHLSEETKVGVASMEEKIIEVNGANLSYAERPAVDGNAAVPLVMLHGYLDSWKSWTNVLPAIPRGRRIISLTHRGWGDSAKTGNYSIDAYAADVEAFIAALGIGHCILVGHSMGTLISTAVAARHPKLVVGLILCSAAAKVRPEHVINPADNTTLGSLGDYIDQVFPTGNNTIGDEGLAFLKSFQLDDLKPFLKKGAVSKEFAQQVMDETLKATPRSYRDAWHDMIIENHTSELALIKRPVLVIWGTADTVFSAPEQQRLHAALANAPLTTKNVSHAPHGVIWTDGKVCAEHMQNWLSNTEFYQLGDHF